MAESDQLAAMAKTLETLLEEREQLVHESARLGQEVRQLRQVAGGDAESQSAQILALKEIVAALTRENLQLVQQGGAQLTAPKSLRQPSNGSGFLSFKSHRSTPSLWQEPALDDETDFTLVDEDTGVDDGFGDFSRASFEVHDFQSELDAAKRCSLPSEPAPVPATVTVPGPEREPEREPEPEPEPEPNLKLETKLAIENESLRTRGKEQREIVQRLRQSLRASQHEADTLRRSLEERTRALVYWSTRVQDRARAEESEPEALNIEDLERIARAAAVTAAEPAAARRPESSRHELSKVPRGVERDSTAVRKARTLPENSCSAAVATSASKRKGPEASTNRGQVEEGIPPHHSQAPEQSLPLTQSKAGSLAPPILSTVDGHVGQDVAQDNKANTADAQQSRATRGLAGLSKRAPAASSRDSFEDASAEAGGGHTTPAVCVADTGDQSSVRKGQGEMKGNDWACPCGFKFNASDTVSCSACDRERGTEAAEITTQSQGVSSLVAKQIPSHYESEEEDSIGWTTPGITTPEPVRKPTMTPRSKSQQQKGGSAVASDSRRVAVTAIPSSDADDQGATGVLGYITLPGPALTVTFQTVRNMIEAGAGGALQGKPTEFVFMRAGAPVGRKQEAKFTVLAKEDEPRLIVLRAKVR